MVLSDEQLTSMRLYPERAHVADLVDSHRALHSQVRELEQANISLMETINLPLNECNLRVHAAQARITALSHENAELTARTGQLEAALKWWVIRQWEMSWHETQEGKDVLTRRAQTDSKLLNPGAYRDWCRDPKLCQDKGTCPKDPTCAD
jgi:hypothetical protein